MKALLEKTFANFREYHIKVALVTHVDKASKYLLSGLAKNKTKEEINRVTIEKFKDVKGTFCKTMTFDNGREFCGHEKLSEHLGLTCFFATPYHS